MPEAMAGRVSLWRTPMRRVEPARSMARQSGLPDVSNGVKPAYPRYNRGLARDSAPSIPNKPRAPMDCAGAGVAPLPPVTAQPDG